MEESSFCFFFSVGGMLRRMGHVDMHSYCFLGGMPRKTTMFCFQPKISPTMKSIPTSSSSFAFTHIQMDSHPTHDFYKSFNKSKQIWCFAKMFSWHPNSLHYFIPISISSKPLNLFDSAEHPSICTLQPPGFSKCHLPSR